MRSNLKRLSKIATIVAAIAENSSGRPFVRYVRALVGSRLPRPPAPPPQRAQCRSRKRQVGRSRPAHEREAAHQAGGGGSSSTEKPTDDRNPGHGTGRQRVEDAGHRDARDGQAGQQIRHSGAGFEARAG